MAFIDAMIDAQAMRVETSERELAQMTGSLATRLARLSENVGSRDWVGTGGQPPHVMGAPVQGNGSAIDVLCAELREQRECLRILEGVRKAEGPGFKDGVRTTAEKHRVPINIGPVVRDRLHALLRGPEMRGYGLTSFINRACELAEGELGDD